MQLIIIAHNLRSAHNVGSLLRTAEGLGVSEVLLSGYTPFPPLPQNDPRLPHEQQKVLKLIHKTALGAENTQRWQHAAEVMPTIARLKQDGYVIAALEQTSDSVKLPDFHAPDKLAIILGREVEGIEREVLQQCDLALEIPMFGKKESFNVVQAAAMALYHCRFIA
ncbi:MAG TPA: TrmH family RNA methyltransferase [Candidatus Saccharimonadales bacterium]